METIGKIKEKILRAAILVMVLFVAGAPAPANAATATTVSCSTTSLTFQIQADGGRNSNGHTDAYGQRFQQPADDFADRHWLHHVRCSAFYYDAADQPNGNGGADGDIHSSGDGHFTADLSMEEERERDKWSNVVLLHNPGDNEFG